MRESTSHQFTGGEEYRLFRASDDDRREATISLASRVRDYYPAGERVANFRELAQALDLPTDRSALTQLSRLLKGRPRGA
jgi:hypothetical protein